MKNVVYPTLHASSFSDMLSVKKMNESNNSRFVAILSFSTQNQSIFL